MELRSSFCAVLLFFFLLSASSPCLATGRLHDGDVESTEEAYDIDYRGPETHSSSFPPPSNSHHGNPWADRTTAGEPTSEHKKAMETKHKVEKIHD